RDDNVASASDRDRVLAVATGRRRAHETVDLVHAHIRSVRGRKLCRRVSDTSTEREHDDNRGDDPLDHHTPLSSHGNLGLERTRRIGGFTAGRYGLPLTTGRRVLNRVRSERVTWIRPAPRERGRRAPGGGRRGVGRGLRALWSAWSAFVGVT